MNDPVQLSATPVAGFAPLAVTFQITSNGAPGTLQQVLYDFNGDDITDFTTNNLDSITYTSPNCKLASVRKPGCAESFYTKCRAWRLGRAVLVLRSGMTFSSAGRKSFKKLGLSWRPPRW